MTKRLSSRSAIRERVGLLLAVATVLCLTGCSSGQAPGVAPTAAGGVSSEMRPTQPPPVAGQVPSQVAASTSRVGRSVPADHTKEKHGAMHKPGYKHPDGVCDACHGQGLVGTASAPSCFSCHGKEWGKD